MKKVRFTGDALQALSPTDKAYYSLIGPLPLCFIVAMDATYTPAVTVTTLIPLSWSPYTMAVSIPRHKQKMVNAATSIGQSVTMALPTCDQLREISVLDVELPQGLCEADAAKLSVVPSATVPVPSIQECPVNLECQVYDTEEYEDCFVVFLEVIAGSIDVDLLYEKRERVVAEYPVNEVDIVQTSDAGVRRVAALKELFLCPTFPIGPKAGWYSTYERWMQSLAEEGYISERHCSLLMDMKRDWDGLFDNMDSEQRNSVRKRLVEALQFIVKEEWDCLGKMLDAEDSP